MVLKFSVYSVSNDFDEKFVELWQLLRLIGL